MYLHLITFALFLISFTSSATAYDVTISPYFWVSKLDNPDAVLMYADEISKFNDTIIASVDQMARVGDIAETILGDKVKESLAYDPLPVDKVRFDRNGRRIKHGFYKYLKENINIEEVGDVVHIKFGVIVKRADIRAFPTMEQILEYPKSRDFDTAQYSAIYPPEPAALLHTSKDKRWGFFQTGFVRGWIRLDNIAFAGDKSSALSYSDSAPLVVTGSFVHVYKDKGFKKILERLPMGSRLNISGEDKNRWVVAFPYRDKNGILKWGSAYISKTKDVHKGFLLYSKKNVILQAFKVLGEGYGWGGIKGRRDCSSFIKDVFASFGINMPRNSRQQISVGNILASMESGSSPDDLKEAIKSAPPGITLIGLNGHIMLYLGSIEDRHYVIHSLFRYGNRIVNKNVVTDLGSGSTARNKAFIDRLKGITIITNESEIKAISG